MRSAITAAVVLLSFLLGAQSSISNFPPGLMFNRGAIDPPAIPPVACTNVTLDFSVTTGCNLTLLPVVLK